MLSTEPRAFPQCVKPPEFFRAASDGLQHPFLARSGEGGGAN
jgi:hypothetical protein